MIRAFSVAWALVLLASSGGCRPHAPPPGDPDAASAPPPREAAPRDANGRLADLVREHSGASRAGSPPRPPGLGAHPADDRLDDVGAEAQARLATRVRSLLERLHVIPEDELD